MPIFETNYLLSLASYKARRKLLLFLPRLMLLAAALVVLFMIVFLIRANLMLFGSYLVPLFASSSWGEAMDSLSAIANMIRGMGGVIAIFVAPLFLVIALIPVLYCSAFFRFSIGSALISIALFGLVVALFTLDSADLPTRLILAIGGPAAAFAIFMLLARATLRDPVGVALLRARRSPPIEQLYRYGLTHLLRSALNILVFGAALTLPVGVLVGSLAVHGILQFFSMFDGSLVVLQLLLLLIIIFLVRPFVANSIRKSVRALKQRNAESATSVYELDQRPRILLLRSFRDDQIEVPIRRSYDSIIYGVSKYDRRLEEIVAGTAYRYGPVGALQDPKESINPLGAARDLSTEGDWREYIEEAIVKAAVIIVIVGDTPNLHWEIETIKKMNRLNRVFFVFPRRSAAALRTEWAFIQRALDETLHPLQSGVFPIVAFCDDSPQWRIVTSDEQGEIDYEEGLTTAFEMSPAFKERTSANVRPVLKVAGAAAAIAVLAGIFVARQIQDFNMEERFNSIWDFPSGEGEELIRAHQSRIDWGERRYSVSIRDAHLFGRFASRYGALAQALASQRRYDEALDAIEKSDENAKQVISRKADDKSIALMTLANNRALFASIMGPRGDSDQEWSAIAEAISMSEEVVAARPDLRDAQDDLAERYRYRGLILQRNARHAEAAADFQKAFDAFTKDTAEATVSPEDEARRKNRAIRFLRTLAHGYFFAGDYSRAEQYLEQSWEAVLDQYDLLLLHLAGLKQGKTVTAALVAQANRLTNKVWPYPVIEFYSGTSSIETVRAATASKEQDCEADFYIGEMHLTEGRSEAAVRLLKSAVERCPPNFIEYTASAAELRRLEK